MSTDKWLKMIKICFKNTLKSLFIDFRFILVSTDSTPNQDDMSASLLIVLVLLVEYISPGLPWDPDAGIIPSWTRYPGASVQVTSSPMKAPNIADGEEKTHWQSGACMPTGFLNRGDLNTLLRGICSREPSSCTTSGGSDPIHATDGSFFTGTRVDIAQGRAFFIIHIQNPQRFLKVAMKGIYKAQTELWVLSAVGWRALHVFTNADNYKFLLFPTESEQVAALKVNSSQMFTITEIAVLAQPCYEMATVDLGTTREIQVVRTRHWSTQASNTTLLTSINGQSWIAHAQLNPVALGSVVTRFPQPVMTRFVAVRHEVKEGNYKKVYVWEIEAWDQYGRWGPPPVPKQQENTLEQLLGVNGIWGWGLDKYSDSALPGEGPEKYTPVATYGRNYHNMNWDVTDPDHVPDYQKMAQGGGTEAKWWLNWDREYGAWKDKGLGVYASIQFLSSWFPAALWNNPQSAGEGYGRAFAQHFGISYGNGLVSAIEISKFSKYLFFRFQLVTYSKTNNLLRAPATYSLCPVCQGLRRVINCSRTFPALAGLRRIKREYNR